MGGSLNSIEDKVFSSPYSRAIQRAAPKRFFSGRGDLNPLISW